VHRLCNFGENVSNTLQDIMLTRTNEQTGQKQFASGHTTLVGGIKIESSSSLGLTADRVNMEVAY